MCGDAVFSAEMVRRGFTVRGYEREVNEGYQAEADLSRPEVMQKLVGMIRQYQVFQVHTSPDCRSFGQLQNLNPNNTRTIDLPQGSTPDEL
jgi:hypothetical protein